MTGEVDMLKALLGLGTSGVVLVLVFLGAKWFGTFLEKTRAHLDDKDKLFAGALKDTTGDIKAAMADVKGMIEEVRRTLVEMDRSHTQNQRETFGQLISLNDKQNGVIGTVIAKVEHLDETVARMNGTLEDHGVKLDQINRALPPPRPAPAPPKS